MHSFTFNGRSSEEFGIRVERFPNLSRSTRKFSSESVRGRNGDIYQLQDAWDEVTVSYQIFAGELAAGAAVTDFTDIMEWLHSADDYAVLTDTYDPAHYRMAVFVDAMEIESQWHTFGKATVSFRCRPQRFRVVENGKHFEYVTVTPLLSDYEGTTNGMTGIIDKEGNWLVYGTAINNWAFQCSIAQSLQVTITQEMVDNNAYLYIDNPKPLPFTVVVTYFLSPYYHDLVNIGPVPANYKVKIDQSLVGAVITHVRCRSTTSGVEIDSTFSPKIVYESDSKAIEDGDQLYNPTNHIAHPIISLKGSMVRSLMDLSTLSMYTGGNVDLHFDILRVTQSYTDVINLYKQGKYVWFKYVPEIINQKCCGSAGTSGSVSTFDNETGTVAFSPESVDWGIGLMMSVNPETSYSISCTADSSNCTEILALEISGTDTNGGVRIRWFAASGSSIRGTFTTMPDTGYVLFIFKRSSGSGSITFSSFMINTGSNKYYAFQPNHGTTPEYVSINDTALSFTTNGFDTAVIDCERENFTINGGNANNMVTVQDSNGNESLEYLRLDKGGNKITMSSGIASATIEPRFWDL